MGMAIRFKVPLFNILFYKRILFIGVCVFPLSLLNGSQSYAMENSIGYIGFKDNEPWAIQFNDCTVYDFNAAEKYLWFDRNLKSISCYSFKEQDVSSLKGQPIELFTEPKLGAKINRVHSFKGLVLSKSGWGTFPLVFERVGCHWYRVEGGWLYLMPSDKKFVSFYAGEQDVSGKLDHDNYFLHH